MWSILSANMNCVFKRVVLQIFVYIYESGNHCNVSKVGHVRLMYDTCSQYGMLQYVMDSIKSGSYVSTLEWKKKVKHVILRREIDTWRANCLVYRSVDMYIRCITYGNVWPWWVFTKHFPKFTVKCKVMIRLLTGNHVMSERKRLNISGRCEECTMMVIVVVDVRNAP